MKTITAKKSNKSNDLGYYQDSATSHEFIIIAEDTAVDEEGTLWQVCSTDDIADGFLAYECGSMAFNYAGDDGNIFDYIDNIMDDEPDKTKWVRENLWENEVYEILKIASDEDDFIARLENKFNESNALPSDFIASKLNGFQRVELINAMNMAIEESIKAIEGTKDEQESFAWYKECKMDEYFHWQELWNNDVKVGEGIDTIAHKFILNDETRQDFEECFEQARDQAIENTKEYFGE